MTPSEHLRAAAALIADEKRWTHGAAAKTAAGDTCDPRSPQACRWCAFGGIIKVSPNPSSFWATHFKFSEVYGEDVSRLNDDYGHAYTIGAMMHVADKLDGLA